MSFKKIIMLLLVPLSLVACSGDDSTAHDSEGNASRIAIVDVPIPDAGLRSCVDRMAARYDIHWADELTYLECNYWGYLTRLREARDIVESQNLASLSGILDFSGLEYFVNIEKLLVAGNYYKAIDVRALKNLRWLSIRNSFVAELDVRNNLQLEFLNIEGTAIKSLDLTRQVQLTELEAGEFGKDFVDVHSEEMQLLAGVFDLDLNDFLSPLESVSVADGAVLNKFNASKAVVSGLDTQWLKEFSGVLSLSDFQKGVALVEFSGDIVDVGPALDLSTHETLASFHLYNSSLEALSIPNTLTNLLVEGNVQTLYAGLDTNLQVIELRSADTFSINLVDLHLDQFQEHLYSLNFTNFHFTGESANFSRLNELEALALDNSVVDATMEVPRSLRTLNLIGDVGRPIFGSNNRISKVTMNGVPAVVCDMTLFDMPVLRELVVRNCESPSMNLSGVPVLRTLRLFGGHLESFDVSQVPNIDVLLISDHRLRELDLGSLVAGGGRSIFSATGNPFSDEIKSSLQDIAELMFDDVRL